MRSRSAIIQIFTVAVEDGKIASLRAELDLDDPETAGFTGGERRRPR